MVQRRVHDRFEDRLAVVVDREVEEPARVQQAEHGGHDGRQVEEIQEGVCQEHVVALALRLTDELMDVLQREAKLQVDRSVAQPPAVGDLRMVPTVGPGQARDVRPCSPQRRPIVVDQVQEDTCGGEMVEEPPLDQPLEHAARSRPELGHLEAITGDLGDGVEQRLPHRAVQRPVVDRLLGGEVAELIEGESIHPVIVSPPTYVFPAHPRPPVPIGMGWVLPLRRAVR